MDIVPFRGRNLGGGGHRVVGRRESVGLTQICAGQRPVSAMVMTHARSHKEFKRKRYFLKAQQVYKESC